MTERRDAQPVVPQAWLHLRAVRQNTAVRQQAASWEEKEKSVVTAKRSFHSVRLIYMQSLCVVKYSLHCCKAVSWVGMQCPGNPGDLHTNYCSVIFRKMLDSLRDGKVHGMFL